MTAKLKQFHEFHPIGGVSAILSPTTSFHFRLARPCAFSAATSNSYVPRSATAPPMIPRAASNVAPFGSPSTEMRIGRSPVTGIRHRMGRPGRTPKILVPLMRGTLPSGGVRMPSCGVSRVRLALNAPLPAFV